MNLSGRLKRPLRLDISTSGFMKHPISVSIKPAAAQLLEMAVLQRKEVPRL